MCKRTIASSCCLFVYLFVLKKDLHPHQQILGFLEIFILDWWTPTKLRTLEKKIIPIDLTSDISIACLQAYIVFWNYKHWISCPVTCSNVSLQSVFPAIELTLTLEFFSLFQQLSLMTVAKSTVYVVLTLLSEKQIYPFFLTVSIYEIVSVLLKFYSSAYSLT